MITIIDAVMGVGKTSHIIEEINRRHRAETPCLFQIETERPTNYLIVVPLLSEVERIKRDCPSLGFVDPQPIKGRKIHHLKQLIEKGANICTTHALFLMLTPDIHRLLKDRRYVLVIDEVLDCVHEYHALMPDDLRWLLTTNFVSVDEQSQRLRWNHKDHHGYQGGRFDDIKNLCDQGKLIYHRGLLLWEFPTDFLQCFDEVFILTYFFLGSPMSALLRKAGIGYSHKTLRHNELVPWDGSDEAEIKAKLRRLITVHEGQINDIGVSQKGNNPLSSSWFDNRSAADLHRMKASTEYFFKKHAETPSSKNAWTTFTKVEKRLRGARYARGFIACNTKATNEHIEKRSLAYLCNVFHNPLIKGYFEERGIPVYEELYALTEMLQWIWRSQIRRNDPITLYIPSERMRSLFKRWLATDNPVELLPRAEEQRIAA